MPETEQKHKSRKIGDLFSDYKTNSNIEDAEIARMNLLKKINTLEIEMQAKEYIEIKEIWYFEKFLRQRFQFEQVHIKIKYAEGVRKKPIADEWENIVCLMAHKYPLMKPLLLLKSQIEVTENQINVYMKIQGADFLKARTLEEVGKEFDVTRERIRQIEAKALRKLRHPSRSKKLRDYMN